MIDLADPVGEISCNQDARQPPPIICLIQALPRKQLISLGLEFGVFRAPLRYHAEHCEIGWQVSARSAAIASLV